MTTKEDIKHVCRELQAEEQITLPAEKHRGIYRKFRVERTDGSSKPGGKHEHCEYFVLDWLHDKFAVPAARAYADACSREFPELARDLRAMANEAAGLAAGQPGGIDRAAAIAVVCVLFRKWDDWPDWPDNWEVEVVDAVLGAAKAEPALRGNDR